MSEDGAGSSRFRTPPVDPSSSWSSTFAGLVQLMVHGRGGEDRLKGEVRARVGEPATELGYRVSRRRDLVRCETLDGAIHFIAGYHTVWARDPNSSELVIRQRSGRFNPALDDLQFGAARPTEDRWYRGDDYTIPTGRETAVTFLDRPAWQVELAPPAHKQPHAMQIIIDNETGLVLRQGSESFGTFYEWAWLDTDADLPDSLFVFDPDKDTLAEPLQIPYGDEPPPGDYRYRVRARIELLDGMLTALENRERFFGIVETATDANLARAAVMTELQLNEAQAYAALDLPAMMFTASARARIINERDQLLRVLDDAH